MGVEHPFGPDRLSHESTDSDPQALRRLIEALHTQPELELKKRLNDPKFRRAVGRLIGERFVKEDWPEKLS
jgi:hypothetical protein